MYINIFLYLRETKIFPLKNIDLKDIDKYIDMQSINITSMDEVYATIRIISIITFSKKMDILNKKVTKEKGLSEYRQELEIIKKGLLR